MDDIVEQLEFLGDELSMRAAKYIRIKRRMTDLWQEQSRHNAERLLAFDSQCETACGEKEQQ